MALLAHGVVGGGKSSNVSSPAIHKTGSQIAPQLGLD